MKYQLPQSIVMPFVVFVGIAILGLLIYFYQHGDARAAKADSFYRAGETAKAMADRKKAFNEALKLYLDVEQAYQPRFGNGKLYYNIGNTYFQLAEFPWALLYYRRAEALRPRDQRVASNLQLARSKLELGQADGSALPSPFFMSLPERLQLFAALALAAVLLCAAWQWSELRWLRNLALVALALAAGVLLTLAYTRYLAPLEGVLVQASDVYRDAGWQYAKVGADPLPAGSEVEMLGSDSSGKWFQILTAKGTTGYVPQAAIRAVGE